MNKRSSLQKKPLPTAAASTHPTAPKVSAGNSKFNKAILRYLVQNGAFNAFGADFRKITYVLMTQKADKSFDISILNHGDVPETPKPNSKIYEVTYSSRLPKKVEVKSKLANSSTWSTSSLEGYVQNEHTKVMLEHEETQAKQSTPLAKLKGFLGSLITPRTAEVR